MTRIASVGEIDPTRPGDARSELTALLPFLEVVARGPDDISPDHLAFARDAGVPKDAIVDALHVNLVWNIISRLANAFDFRLREGQLESGTRALHRLSYRFPRVLTGRPAGITATAEPGAHGDRGAEVLRSSVFESPGHTSPATRTAAGNGDPLPEPLASYAAKVRDNSHEINDDDIARLHTHGYSEDEIFEVTVAAAVGASLRSLHAGRVCLSRVFTT
jgi:alkylhydroperoxidase family enzyme